MDEVFAVTSEAIAAEDGPLARVRAWPTRTRVAVVVAAGLAIALAVLVVTPRADLVVFPLKRLVGVLLALSMAMGGAMALGLAPLARASSPARVRVLAALAWLVPIAVALLPPAHAHHPASLAGVGADLVPRALACFAFGLGTGIPLGLVAWLVARPGFAASRIRVGLLVLAAAMGSLALVLHCPLTAVVHQAAGHATVAVALALVAVGVLRVAGRPTV